MLLFALVITPHNGPSCKLGHVQGLSRWVTLADPSLAGFTRVDNPVLVSGSKLVMFVAFRVLSRNCNRTALW